jgi:hypothetical protein
MAVCAERLPATTDFTDGREVECHLQQLDLLTPNEKAPLIRQEVLAADEA